MKSREWGDRAKEFFRSQDDGMVTAKERKWIVRIAMKEVAKESEHLAGQGEK